MWKSLTIDIYCTVWVITKQFRSPSMAVFAIRVVIAML